ncbi:hypothetical protein ACJX0J_026175 [Zea mays]
MRSLHIISENEGISQEALDEYTQLFNKGVVFWLAELMQFIARSTLISVLGAEFSEYVFLPSNGASGGILFHKQEGGTWWLTFVYGPQGDEEKISFLQELRNGVDDEIKDFRKNFIATLVAALLPSDKALGPDGFTGCPGVAWFWTALEGYYLSSGLFESLGASFRNSVAA